MYIYASMHYVVVAPCNGQVAGYSSMSSPSVR